MKNFRAAAAAAILLGSFAATQANATVINYSGADVNMGTLSAGQSGTISSNVSGSTVGPYIFDTGSDYGMLGGDEQITFTYNFTDIAAGTLHALGAYNYTAGGLTYNGSAVSDTGGSTVSSGTTNGLTTAPLVFASANLNGPETAGTVTITNLSKGVASIQSLFSGLFTSSARVVSVSYQVSSVPLPASFPMFAAALAGLFGFAFFRKRRAI